MIEEEHAIAVSLNYNLLKNRRNTPPLVFQVLTRLLKTGQITHLDLLYDWLSKLVLGRSLEHEHDLAFTCIILLARRSVSVYACIWRWRKQRD